jgi:hypothetical protein
MANCFFCGESTQLYSNGEPICLKCEERKDEQRRALTPSPSLSRIEQVMNAKSGQKGPLRHLPHNHTA